MFINPMLQLIKEGGLIFMIPLIVLSMLSIAVILERIYCLAKYVLLKSDEITRLEKTSREKKHEQTRSILESSKSLSALIIKEAIENTQYNSNFSIEQNLQRAADKHIEWLTQRLWMLRAIGHIAPLLGLMGTVVGLSISFRQISEVGLSQKSVAGGISIALITTITGLGIALPTLFAEYSLRAWAQSHYRKIKALLQDFAEWYESKD